MDRDRTALRADAQQLEQAGRIDEAIAVLEVLFSMPSPDAEWLRDAIALSRCYRDSGSCEQAVAVGERAAPHVDQLGLVGLTEAIQLTVTVAGAELFLGDPGRAMRTCLRALAAAEQHGSAIGKASALWNMCLVETARGNIVTAIARAREALGIFETSDDVRNIARLRTEIAALQLDLDPPDPAEALRLLADHELDLIGAGGSAWDVAYLHLQRGRAHVLVGDVEEARACVRRVDEVRPAASVSLAAFNDVLAGRVAHLDNDPAAARRHFQAAAQALTAIGSDRSVARTWFELAGLLAEVGDTEGAAAAYRSAGAANGLRVT